MANEIDEELYPGNDSHTTCRPKKWGLHPSSGVEQQVPLSGLTDLKAYISQDEDADDESDAIHGDLVETMTEVMTTAAYEATLTGVAKEHIVGLSLADGAKLYMHWQSGTQYHEVAELIWRPNGRPA